MGVAYCLGLSLKSHRTTHTYYTSFVKEKENNTASSKWEEEGTSFVAEHHAQRTGNMMRLVKGQVLSLTEHLATSHGDWHVVGAVCEMTEE